MFVKANNGVAEKFPYTIGELRRDNPKTSFPKNVSFDILARYNVFTVTEATIPEFDKETNRAERSKEPVLDNGVWVWGWEILPLTEQEIATREETKASTIRSERNALLSASDWVVVLHTEKGTNIPLEWEVYRQALRDITAQVGFPHTVEWPVKPGVN